MHFVTKIMTQAQAALELGDFFAAIQDATAATELSPRWLPAQLTLGRVSTPTPPNHVPHLRMRTILWHLVESWQLTWPTGCGHT